MHICTKRRTSAVPPAKTQTACTNHPKSCDRKPAHLAPGPQVTRVHPRRVDRPKWRTLLDSLGLIPNYNTLPKRREDGISFNYRNLTFCITDRYVYVASYLRNAELLESILNTVDTSHSLSFRCCTAAQDSHIRNFRVASRNSTHITFSWDIVDGYYSSSYIDYFYLYYQHRTSTYSLYIPYRSATSNGATFSYTSSLAIFNNGPYAMWVRVYRDSRIQPRITLSKKKFMKFSKYSYTWEYLRPC